MIKHKLFLTGCLLAAFILIGLNLDSAEGTSLQVGGGVNYSLIFANLSRAVMTVNNSQNASIDINVTSNSTFSANWTFTVVTNTATSSGFVEGLSKYQLCLGNYSSNENNSATLHINITDTRAEAVTFYVLANFTNSTQDPKVSASIILNTTTEVNLSTVTFTDDVAPVIYLVSPANTTKTNNINQSFVCNITDGTGISNLTIYVWNSSADLINKTTFARTGTSNSTAVNITLPVDGSYNWTCIGYDTAVNLGSSAKGNFTLIRDRIAPSLIRIAYPVNNANFTSKLIKINVTFADAVSLNHTNISIWLNGLIAANSTDNTTVGTSGDVNDSLSINSTDGAYTIIATVYDSAGNSNSTSINITIDATVPAVNIVSPINNTYTNALTQAFTCNITDAMGVSNVTFYIWNSSADVTNNQTVALSNTPNATVSVTMTLPINASYNWTCIGRDRYSNLALSAKGNYTIFVDRAAPSAIVMSKPTNNLNFSAKKISINVTVADSLGLNHTNISIWLNGLIAVNSTDNTTIGTTSDVNESLSVASDGVYTVIATTYDNAGNSNFTSVNITIDTTGPVFAISSPKNNSVYYINQTIIVSLDVVDLTLNARKFNYNGTGNITYTGPINISYETNNTYNITFYANDSFGKELTTYFIINVTARPSTTTLITNETTVNVNSTAVAIVLPYNSTLQTITVNNTYENLSAYLDVSQSMGSGAVASLGNYSLNLTRLAATSHSVIFSRNTNITGPAGWNGRITLPKLNTSTFSAPSGSTNAVLDCGTASEINFTSPVRIIFSGMTGKRGAWSRGSTTLTDITLQCNNDTNPTNIALNATSKDCYISAGDNLNIWTYHFTTFAAFTPAASPAESSSGGGGGGGGGGATCMTNWTCTEWSSCVAEMQSRTCSLIDSSCTNETAKPEESQSCSISTETPEEQEQKVIAGKETKTPSGKGFLIGVTVVAILVIIAGIYLVRMMGKPSKR